MIKITIKIEERPGDKLYSAFIIRDVHPTPFETAICLKLEDAYRNIGIEHGKIGSNSAQIVETSDKDFMEQLNRFVEGKK